MKIAQIQLKNFKRFTDLRIDLGNSAPKLVLLIGANGSGKSGVFDAFEFTSKYHDRVEHRRWQGRKVEKYYFKKEGESQIKLTFNNSGYYWSIVNDDGSLESVNSGANLNELSFYGRSAVRYLPRITRTVLGETIDVASNSDKPAYYIDVDVRFENDIDILAKRVLDQILKAIGNFSEVKDLHITQFEEVTIFLGKVNGAFSRVFGENTATSLKFMGPLTPADGESTKLMFSKGETQNMNYDLLSSGEKEVVNILFNLFVRTPIYQDTIYFFDELDAHLHTSLQYNLLKEIVENWIPDHCQIWTATHSLGFIQYAQSSADAAIIDFDNHDFDLPVVLSPQKTQEIFDIAVPKDALKVLFKDKKLIFCENENAALLNSIGTESTLFLGDIDKSSITLRIEQDKSIYGLIDRDFLSDSERRELLGKFQNLRILEYYCFENYLYHPDNLQECYPVLNIEEYTNTIKKAKNSTKGRITQKLDNDRRSYIFYKKNFLSYRNEAFDEIISMLESDNFETFYKVFSMKKQGNLCQLHNIRQEELVKTDWFKSQMNAIISQ